MSNPPYRVATRKQMPIQGRHIEVRGVVQGVGFRPFVFQLANRDGIRGRVCNDTTGVMIDAFGQPDDLDRFIFHIRSEAPPAARVRSIECRAIPPEEIATFAITDSEASPERNVSIPPDLSICDDCLKEIFDPSDRRYLYPFTNCTNCGPRYSIVRGIPYDRPATTMAGFRMCSDCRREYESPRDRRFHAQPNACPKCGPKLTAVTREGVRVRTDSVVGFAARTLRAQMIVAVKGIGGFHLACDATSSVAVQRLRERKLRDAKPLAVMVRDIDAAAELAEIDQNERQLLTSVERPIVLLRRREQAKIAPEVACDNPLIGLFLPYTPLHHILLREVNLPLVMTSGNLADEPMAHENDEALERLRDIADVFLMHDRPIETRVDDSVVRVIAGSPTVLRHARGFVPRPIVTGHRFAEPVLGCGAHLKNAICIGSGEAAFLGPHIGDLETLPTLRAFESAVEQMKRFVGVAPSVVAHDLHPDYFSTQYAQKLEGVRRIGVQHHHAHVVSAMAEHGLTGPVLGFAYDGTGFGTDGTSWGGEVMIADERTFDRIATFRSIPLAGGDQAIRQVWRVALALLDDAFAGEPPLDALALFEQVPARSIVSIRQMIATNLNAPRARGVGRYFDALGAIALSLTDARYEGEVAFRWNMVADPAERRCYPAVIRDEAQPWEIDLRPLVRAAVRDVIDGVAISAISARFHNTVAEVSAEVARLMGQQRGTMPIVLSGGCFQNALLAEGIVARLGAEMPVFMNRHVPPGDGGVALGQAIIADAVVRAGDEQTVLHPTEVPACV